MDFGMHICVHRALHVNACEVLCAQALHCAVSLMERRVNSLGCGVVGGML